MMDVAGYSRLIARDAQGTVSRWVRLRDKAIGPTIVEHGGRAWNFSGDGLVVEFPSAAHAIRGTLDIQRRVADLEESVSDSIRLRIGIHLGDVLSDDNELHGNAANVAARLQTFASPGTVMASETVVADLPEYLQRLGMDVGALRLKNFPVPIRAFRFWGSEAHGTLPVAMPRYDSGLPSLSVLAFACIGGADDDRYLAQGLTEGLVSCLSTNPELFVVARGVLRLPPVETAASADRLGVRYIVSGTLQRSGARVRVTAQLADREAGRVIWSDRLDAAAGDIFGLQDMLAQRVIEQVAPHVRLSELSRALRKRPERLDAYEAVLRATDKLYKLDLGEFRQAGDLLRRALAIDPNYAYAHALLAIWFSIRVEQGWSESVSEDRTELLTEANTAVALDPGEPAALAFAGHARSIQLRDYHGAVELFDRAIASSPSAAVAWIRSSPTYAYMGNGIEASRRAREALRLSPFDHHVFFTYATIGLAAYMMDDYVDAVTWCERAERANPRFTANLRILAASLVAASRLPEARSVAGALMRADPGFRVAPFIERYAIRDNDARALFGRRLVDAGVAA